MARTRTKAATKAPDAAEVIKTTTPKVQLGPESANPPLLFILPEDASAEARIISLENPRYQSEDRYLVCPEKGVYEFTKVAAPKTTPRSWLLCPDKETTSETGTKTKEKTKPKGFVTRNADLFIATPIDPLFLLLPVLNPSSKPSESGKKLFLSGDDYLERIATSSPQISSLLRGETLRRLLERRMGAVCETVNAGDETMYRWDEGKLLEELLKKARQMVKAGLPESMEEKLIRKALEAPLLSIRREDSSMHELNREDTLTSEAADASDTQTTISGTDSPATSFSGVSTAATSFSGESTITNNTISKIAILPPNAPDGVVELLRLRTAFLFICSNYIAPYISTLLKKRISSLESPIDFGPLDIHMAELAKLRQEAIASRSLGDYSRKRGMDDDDETIEIREEKKRKKEEDDKRKKAGVSVGLRKLQKVNTTGMKKMSDFFKKK